MEVKPLTFAAVLVALGTARAADPGAAGIKASAAGINVSAAGINASAAGIDSSPAASKPAREPAQIFATTCGWCHHKGGREAGKGPQLMGTKLSDGEIVQRIRKGKPGFMPGYEGAFSEDELNGLVLYIRALRPR